LVANARRFGQLERSRIEFLVHNDRARAVPNQDFHRVTALAHEDKQRLAPRLRPHPLTHQTAETLVAHPHVDGLERNVHWKTLADHDAALNAAITRLQSSRGVRAAPVACRRDVRLRPPASETGILRTAGFLSRRAR